MRNIIAGEDYRSFLYIKSRLEMNSFRSGWDSSWSIDARNRGSVDLPLIGDDRCRSQRIAISIWGYRRSLPVSLQRLMKRRFCLWPTPGGGGIWIMPPIILRKRLDGFCHWSATAKNVSLRSTSPAGRFCQLLAPTSCGR